MLRLLYMSRGCPTPDMGMLIGHKTLVLSTTGIAPWTTGRDEQANDRN